MSQTRFAPITSNLLARKGDAVPSAVAAKPAMLWSRDEPAPFEPRRQSAPPPGPPDKPHKIMVALTPVEYEKLGIAAVKKGVTRHQIVRTALDLHLDRLKREYGGCGCMATGGSCGGGCGAG